MPILDLIFALRRERERGRIVLRNIIPGLSKNKIELGKSACF
jgi:hypothetical protein